MKAITNIIVCLFFVLCGYLSATAMTIGSDPYNHADLSSATQKYYYPDSYLDMNCLLKKWQQSVDIRFDLGEDYEYGDLPFTANLTIELSGFDNIIGGNELFTKTQQLSIDEDHPEQYVQLKVPVMPNPNVKLKYLICKILSYNLNEPIVAGAIRLQVDIMEDPLTDVRTPPYDVNSLITLNPVNGHANPVNFSWDAACNDIAGYQLQVLRLYNTDENKINNEQDIGTIVDWGPALNVNIEGDVRSFPLSLVEGNGYYLWRVRPVGNRFPGGIANPKNTGVWSVHHPDGVYLIEADLQNDPSAFFYTQFDADKNMIYSRSFTEGNRVNEAIAYADGLLRSRQSQTRLPSLGDSILTAQSLIDYSGRRAGNSIPAPVAQGGLGYKEGFMLDGQGQLYTAKNFDDDLNYKQPEPIADGPLQDYYSNDNTDTRIPNAEGYPFSRTRYSNDGTQRTKESASAGATYALGGQDAQGRSHTGHFRYEKPSDQELIRVFGDEAPDAESVFKVITISPDYQKSIRYVDFQGKILATALGIAGDHPTMDHLSSRSGATMSIHSNILAQEDDNVVQKINKSFDEPTAVTFNYQLMPPGYGMDCDNVDFCATCDYTVRLEIKELESNQSVDLQEFTLAPQSCDGQVEGIQMQDYVFVFQPGEYQISRTLITNNTAPEASASYIEEALEKVRDSLLSATEQALQQVKQFLAGKDLDGLYAHLDVDPDTTVQGYKTPYDLGCCQIDIPVMDCGQGIDCNNLPDFEALLYESHPELGDAANDFFFRRGIPLYPPQIAARFSIDNPGELQLVVRTKIGEMELIDGTFDYDDNLTELVAYINNRFVDKEIHFMASVFDDVVDELIVYATRRESFTTSGDLLIAILDDQEVKQDEFNGNGNSLYADGSGAFNTLIDNMIADGYDCNLLWQTWNGLVNTYKTAANYKPSQLEEGEWGPIERNYDFDLLQAFLQAVGYQFEYYSNCPYGDCNANIPGDDGYLEYAHKFVPYSFPGTYPECESIEDEQGNTFPDWAPLDSAWIKFNSCVQSMMAVETDGELTTNKAFVACEGTENVLECAEAIKDSVEAECITVCEARMGSFIEELIAIYQEEGFTVQEDPDVPGQYQMTYGDLLCQAQALVKECEASCSITVYSHQEQGETVVDSLGNKSELESIREVMTGTYVLAIPDMGSCGNSYEIADQPADKTAQALFYLDQQLKNLLGNAPANGTCWDYTDDLLNVYDPADLLSATQFSSQNCLTGVSVVPNADYTLYAVTPDNYQQYLNIFLDKLNDKLQEHKDFTIKIPYGLPLDINGSCESQNAASYSSLTLEFGQGDLNVTTSRAYGKNLFSSCNDLALPETGTFYLDDQLQLHYLSGIIDYTMCLKFCVPNSCSINFNQTISCEEKGQLLVGMLNEYTHTGGTIPADQFPPFLTFGQGSKCLDATTQFPKGLKIIIREDMGTAVFAHGDTVYIRPGGLFVTDKNNGDVYYQEDPNSPSVSLVPTLERCCEREQVAISTFSCELNCIVTSCDPVCIEWTEIPEVTADTLTPFDCYDAIVELIEQSIDHQVNECIDQQVELLAIDYQNTCPKPQDSYTMAYDEGIHHYTLYYHDRAGNLIRTVPPKGVDQSTTSREQHSNHNYTSTYEYNSFGQLTEEHTPDGGKRQFWYDNKGGLRFSQTAQQALDLQFKYIRYDALGRPIEHGLCQPEGTAEQLAQLLDENRNDIDFPQESGYKLSERVIMVYEAPYPGTDPLFGPQRYLRNLLGYIINDEDGDMTTLHDQHSIRYSYDPHGAIEWVIRETAGLGKSRIRYSYDLVSRNLLEIAYNEGAKDQFFQRYTYNAENRPIGAQSSVDGLFWDRDVNFSYYPHGPVKRIGFGEDKVQGLDYVYTLQGNPKAINHPELGTAKDPGKDGVTNRVAADAFGMILGYYEGDFSRQGSVFNSTVAQNSAYLSAADKNGENRNLYSGNVTSWVSNVQDENGQATGITGRQFHYDEIGRLTQSTMSTFDNQWNSTTDYQSSYSYDANGNITSLTRHGYQQSGHLAMDDFTYHYLPHSNKLDHIDDIIDPDHYTTDMDDQQINNYSYDADGNLIADQSEGVNRIVWNASGKVSRVERVNDTITFAYGPSGERVRKSVIHAGQATVHTFYVRDLNGKILATYKREDGVPDNNQQSVSYQLLEHALYAGSRIGQRVGTAAWDLGKMAITDLPAIPDSAATLHHSAALRIAVPFKRSTSAKYRVLNFNEDPMALESTKVLYSGNAPVAVATAEDRCGNELFSAFVAEQYDGNNNVVVILDRYGNIMKGYENIPADFNSRMIVVGQPGTEDRYYLVTARNGALYYHTIDLSVKGYGDDLNPFGEVVGKNKELIKIDANGGDSFNAWALAAIEDREGIGNSYLYTLLHADSENKTYVEGFRITENGFGMAETLHEFNARYDHVQTSIAISPEANRMAISFNEFWTTKHGIKLLRMAEDHSTLSFLNQHEGTHASKRVYSCAFDPTQTYVYFVESDLGGNHKLRRFHTGMLGTFDVNGATITNATADIRTAHNQWMYLAVKDERRIQEIQEPQSNVPVFDEHSLDYEFFFHKPKLSGALPLQAHRIDRKGTCELKLQLATRSVGQKRYELNDHLGNVRAVITDRKLSTVDPNTNLPQDFTAEVSNYTDYYPFGMQMPGKTYIGQSYRYGFSGMEQDPEWNGEGNMYTTEFRQYDPRVGRWLSLDALKASFPGMSPFNAMDNNPVVFNDITGLCVPCSPLVQVGTDADGDPIYEDPADMEEEDEPWHMDEVAGGMNSLDIASAAIGMIDAGFTSQGEALLEIADNMDKADDALRSRLLAEAIEEINKVYMVMPKSRALEMGLEGAIEYVTSSKLVYIPRAVAEEAGKASVFAGTPMNIANAADEMIEGKATKLRTRGGVARVAPQVDNSARNLSQTHRANSSMLSKVGNVAKKVGTGLTIAGVVYTGYEMATGQKGVYEGTVDIIVIGGTALMPPIIGIPLGIGYSIGKDRFKENRGEDAFDEAVEQATIDVLNPSEEAARQRQQMRQDFPVGL